MFIGSFGLVCIAMIFYGGGLFVLGQPVQGLALASLAAGWLGVLTAALSRAAQNAWKAYHSKESTNG